MKPHKHAELIKKWADGADIQYRWSEDHDWDSCERLTWYEECFYRIKPEHKPDVVEYFWATWTGVLMSNKKSEYNLKLTFDGETAKLKSAEVI